jgi:hypothetical protein
MSDYLTTLPVELIYKILENVPLVDILSSVCLVNKRLRSISLIYPRSHLDFSCVDTSMDKSKFDSICTQMLCSTSQVVSLTLFDKDDLMTSTKNDLFFSRFKIIDTTFPNLRVLTLTYITYRTWCLFKTRFPPLIMTLFINLYLSGSNCNAYLCTTEASDILNGLLFLSPLLQRLSVKMANVSKNALKIRRPNSSALSSVQYLHIDYAKINLFSLVAVTPMLQTLECCFEASNLKSDKIYPRLYHLQRLQIELWNITLTKMTTLLSAFPQLAYLTVIAHDLDSDMADGRVWERLLQQIKHFEFKFIFTLYTSRQEPLSLDSFRTKFWLEEKKWFVTYDRSSNPNNYSMLYSNSSSIIVSAPHEIIKIIGTMISETTASEPASFFNVDNLKIHDPYLRDQLFHRYKNVKKLYVFEITTVYLTTFNDLVANLDTSYITTCIIYFQWSTNSSYEYIRLLRSLPRLRRIKVPGINLSYLCCHQWPHIVDLNIADTYPGIFYMLSSNDIDALCHSFPHIKRLTVYSLGVADLSQFLNKMKMTLIDIIIEQPREMFNREKFITRQWIEKNTELKNFHYACTDLNAIYLWL